MNRESLLRKTFTPLNLHATLVVLLLIFDLVLTTRLAVAWHESGSDKTTEYLANLTTYQRLQTQAGKLHSLPEALQGSNKEARAFYTARVSDTDSAIAAELGAIAKKDNVRLSAASYKFGSAIPGIVEVNVEAGMTGDYRSLMHFINDLERDKDHNFFTVRTLTFSSQQGGAVNLRIRLTTYIRGDASQLVSTNSNGAREEQ